MNLVVGLRQPAEGTPPDASAAIRMRVAQPADRSFAMSVVPRFVASSPARWRNPRKASRAYATTIEAILGTTRSHSALLVGECDHDAPLGLVLLSAASNCYTHERQGHVAHAAVAEGWRPFVGATDLIRATRAWARSQGYVVLTPDEFWIEHPAMALGRGSAPGAAVGEPAVVISMETGR